MLLRLRELRIENGMSQAEVAEKIHVTTVVYNRYERGIRQPKLETILALSSLFGVTVGQLLGVEERDALTQEELNLLSAYRKLSEREREEITRTVLSKK